MTSHQLAVITETCHTKWNLDPVNYIFYFLTTGHIHKQVTILLSLWHTKLYIIQASLWSASYVCWQCGTTCICPPLLLQARQQSIDISCLQGLKQQTCSSGLLLWTEGLLLWADSGTDRQTDRRTLYCYIDPAPHTTVYEGSAKKINVQLHSINHTQTDWLMAKLTVRWTYTASCGYTSVNATLWDGFARHTCMCIHIIMTCYNTKSFHSFSYIIVQMCYSKTGYRLLTNRNCISRWIYQWRWQSYI